MKNTQLVKELRQAGAKPSEVASLTRTAGQLKRLGQVDKPSRWEKWRLAAASAAAAICLILGGGTVAFAQTSMPGSMLYPAKKLSENVAVTIKPSYKATMMMRRSEEVRHLINNSASQHAVMATLADYQTTASSYRAKNYPAFEYCKDNLKQAAAAANNSERQAINQAIAELPDAD